tara:strand:+ start:672 stop:947 length:276 start_codon:yes stop_codon:yes gene_type:complete
LGLLKLIGSFLLVFFLVAPSSAEKLNITYILPENKFMLRFEGYYYGTFFVLRKEFDWHYPTWHPSDLASVPKIDYKELYNWLHRYNILQSN